MSRKNNSNLFFTCSLIEYIGRQLKQPRDVVVKQLGINVINHIYQYADILHCEPIAKVADDFITMHKLNQGNFDNVKSCEYLVPDYWTIGEVYERLIEDISDEENIVEILVEVYCSWINEFLSNYNLPVYYQSREYIRECYLEKRIL